MPSLSKRRQFMIWLFAALLATAGLTAVLVSERRPDQARYSLYVAGDPAEGARLFFGEKGCSACHAVKGIGGRRAPDLGGFRSGTPAMGWLAVALWNHAPAMWRQMGPGQRPHIDAREMAHILAFLFNASYGDRRGNREAGRQLFSAKGCARCHGSHSAGATGVSRALPLAGAAHDPTGWMQAMWNHAQAMVGPVTRELGQWPQLSGEEMNDLIAFAAGNAESPAGAVSPASAARGWTAFQARCMPCHAVRGNGGRVGPELGPDRSLPRSTAEFAAVLWNHAPAMVRAAPGAGMRDLNLRGGEIADIFAFLASLRYVEPAGSPFLGERVFRERGCAGCHGSKAEGTRLGPALRARPDAFTTASLAAALWNHAGPMSIQAGQAGMEWPGLEPADIGDLIGFLNQR